jgi:hypothetical protein
MHAVSGERLHGGIGDLGACTVAYCALGPNNVDRIFGMAALIKRCV